MRFRLRTLQIVLALGPPVLAIAWHAATPPPQQSGPAIVFLILAGVMTAIAYWPRVMGKGG